MPHILIDNSDITHRKHLGFKSFHFHLIKLEFGQQMSSEHLLINHVRKNFISILQKIYKISKIKIRQYFLFPIKMFLKVFLKKIGINFLIELSKKKKKSCQYLGKHYVELCYLQFQYFDVTFFKYKVPKIFVVCPEPAHSVPYPVPRLLNSFILIFIQKSAFPYSYLFLLLSLFRSQCFQEFNFPGNINSSHIPLCFQILQLFVILGLY